MATKVTSTGQTTYVAEVAATGQTTFVKKITIGTPVSGIVSSVISLAGLNDTTFTNLENFDLLNYDSASGKWVNTDSATLNSLTLKSGGRIRSSLIPYIDSALDLGTADLKWRDLHLSGGTIFLGGLSLKDTGNQFSVQDSQGTTLPLDISGSTSAIRALFSSGGDITYDSNTGVFSVDVELSYSSANFDSDLDASISGGTGLSYDSATNTISILNTGVTANSYGSATEIPVLTVNAQGQITTVTTTTVAGVTSVNFDSTNGTFTVNTADGSSFSDVITLDPFTTSNLAEGNNLYYTTARADSDARHAVSAAGDLSYNPNTGVFQFDVEQVYTKANFDSDLGDANTGQLPEGSNLYYTTARADSAFDIRLATKSTTNLSEGNNLYYTTARTDSDAKRAISGSTGVTYNNTTGQISIGQPVGTTDIVTFKEVNADSASLSTLRFTEANKKILLGSGSDMQIFHNGNGGVIQNDETGKLFFKANDISFTSYTDSENLAHFFKDGSVNLYYDNSKKLETTSSGVTIFDRLDADSVNASGITTQTLDVTGRLTVTGSQTIINTETLSFNDPLLHLAESNTAGDILDIGFVANFFNQGQIRHTGFFRDADNKEYYIFNDLVDSSLDSDPPNIAINRNGTDFNLANFNAGIIRGQYAGFDSDFSQKTTDNLSEGTNSQRRYFTQSRVDSAIDARVTNTFIDNLFLTIDSSELPQGFTLTGDITANNLTANGDIETSGDFRGKGNLLRGPKGPAFLDSTNASQLIIADVDKAFIDALNVDADTLDNQDGTYYLNYNNFTNTPNILDSTNVSSIITNDVDATFINNLTIDADTLGNNDSTYYLNYNNFTNTPAIPTIGNDFVDSAYVTSVLPTLGNDFVDSAYVTSVLPTLGNEFVDSSYVTSVLPTLGNNFVDSSTVSAIITADVDASFLNALTIDADTLGGQNSAYHLNYINFTNTPTIPTVGNDFVDSAIVSSIIASTDLVDSTDVSNIIIADVDASFINTLTIDADTLGNQNGSYYLNYNNFTNTPNILDSTNVSSIITNDVDVTFVNALNVNAVTLGGQNSAYHLNYNNFTNTPNVLDSTNVSDIITADVDKAFVDTLGVDASTLGGNDSDYYLNYNNFTNTPTIPTLYNDFVDSTVVSSIITADVDATFINALTIDADTLGGQNSAFHLNYNNFTNTPNVLDSTNVSSIITADVDKAFVDALSINADQLDGQEGTHYLDYSNFTNTPTIPTLYNDFIDSAIAISLIDSGHLETYIDSAWVQLRQATGAAQNVFETIAVAGQDNIVADNSTDTLTFAAGNGITLTTNAGTDTITITGSAGTDSATVSAIITADVDAAFINALTIDADTLGGQNSAYHLNYNNFTNTPTIPTIGNDFVDSAAVSTIIASDIDSAQIRILINNLDINPGIITADSAVLGEVAFNTSFHDSHIGFQEGALWYDPHHKNLNYYTDFDHPIEIGLQVIERVYNNNAYTINKGQPLYYSGNRTDEAGQESPTVDLANATSSTKYNVQGLAAEDIPQNAYGQIVVAGVIDGFDTSGLTAGLNFFAGLTDGSVQNAPPVYPNYPMCLGWVITSDSNVGKVIINQQNHSVNSFRVQGDTHISADLRIDGDLIVAGTQTITSTENVQIGGNIQYLNAGNTIGETGTTFVGTGLDDAFYAGHYSGDSSTKSFFVKIDATGTPDTFEWGFDSTVGTEATGILITGAEQMLDSEYGISIDFGATTGHTLNDKWTGTAIALNTDTGLFSNKNEGDGGNGYTHVGIYWDASQDEWTFVGQLDSEPEAPIDRSSPTFQYGDVRGKDFYGTTFNGALSGNASTATALATGRTIDITGVTATGQSFDGTSSIDIEVTAVPASLLTGTILDARLPASISSDITGNAATATTATTATGATNIDIDAITSTDTTTFPVLVGAASTGNQVPIIDNADLSYNANTGTLSATAFSGDGSALTGLPSSGTDSATVSAIITADVDAAFINALTIDADTLGELAATSFLRSNAADTKTSGNLTFNDGIEAVFGSGTDLRIFHSGGNSIIRENNGNPVYIQTDGTIHLTKNNASETLAKFIGDGAVELYHNNVKKLETTSSGIDVNGSVTVGTSDTYVLDAAESTLSTVTQTALTTFAHATYGAAKFIVTAVSGGERHITEILVTHDGTTAVATEYGTVITNGILATYDVDISGDNVRLLATGESATSTTYKVAETLIEA